MYGAYIWCVVKKLLVMCVRCVYMVRSKKNNCRAVCSFPGYFYFEVHKDFQRVFKTTKLDRGLNDTPLTDDNIEELGRDICNVKVNTIKLTVYLSLVR